MRSLGRQLTVNLLCAFALILGAGGLSTYWAMRESLYDQFDAGLRDKAGAIITSAVPRGESLSVYFSDRFLRAFDDDIGTEFFQVFDEQGQSVARSDSLHNVNLPHRFGAVETPAYWNLKLPISGEPGRAVGIQFEVPPRRRDPDGRPLQAVVVVAAEQASILNTLRDLRINIITTLVGALVLTVLAVWITLRYNLRPLQSVSRKAADIDSNRLNDRLPVESLPIELQPMTAKVNALLERLQASFERERQFSANLAHELRTPIAELRSLAEVALKWPEDRDPLTDQTVLEIAEQLESRVTTLLQLARAEQGQITLKEEALNLAEICETALRPFQGVLQPRNLALDLKLPNEPVTIQSDAVLLHSILGNLLDNATSYAPGHSTIGLHLTTSQERFQISIHNEAPELDSASMESLFDRFWRQDAARSTARHAGLGLSLVRTYATLLGLEVTAQRSDDRILSIALKGDFSH